MDNKNELILPPPNKFILGLDMATHTSGISLLDTDGKLVISKCIFGGDGDEIQRSINIYKELDLFIKSYLNNIKCAVIEDILLNKWVPNLNACRSLIRLQGIIIACLFHNGIKYEIYTANHWKSVVGILSGPEGKTRSAQKDRAIKLVKDKYNIDVDDNQADAICIALSYLINNNYLNK